MTSNVEAHSLSSIDYQRRVRLLLREDDDAKSGSLNNIRHRRDNHSNLFVRLSSEVAWDLQNLLLSTPNVVNKNEEDDNTVNDDSCWFLVDDQASASSPSVDFLPLRITLQPHDENEGGSDCHIYASFNGGTIHCDDNIGTIELPRSILPEDVIESNIPTFVSVEAFPSIEYGARVEVEPLTTEDWELLEIHSEAMENGDLLDQVSVVYPNQMLDLRVGKKRDKVKLLVKDVQTVSSLVSSTNNTIWPELVKPSGVTAIPAPPECALLVQNTEVVVIPKPRQPKKTLSWTTPLRLIPSEVEWGIAINVFKGISHFESFPVESFSIMVNEEQWPYENKWARVKPEKTKYVEKLVRVVPSPSVPLNHAVMHLTTRLDMMLHLYLDSVLLKPHLPKVIGIDAIALERVQLVDIPQKNKSAWNVPDVFLSPFSKYPSVKSLAKDTVTPIALPVGALLSRGVFENQSSQKESTQQEIGWELIRVVLNSEDQGLKRSVVSINRSSLQSLISRLDEFRTGSAMSADMEMLFRGPQHHVGSIDWTLPIIERMKIFPSVGIKVFGPNGSGKSHSITLLAACASLLCCCPVFYLNCKRLQKSSAKMAGILGELDAIFRRVTESTGAVVVLDDLDSLSPNLVGNDESNSSSKMHSANPTAVDQSKVISDRILNLFESCSVKNGVLLIASCAALDSINPLLFRSLKVPVVSVKVPVLSSEFQVDLLKTFIRRRTTFPDTDHSIEGSSWAQRLAVFLPRDMEKLAFRVVRLSETISRTKSIDMLLQEALDDFVPLAQMQASNRNRSAINLHWDDIGGLFKAKENLDSVVCHPILYRRIYDKATIRLPRGILLFGPPGCGKSCIVPALSQACNYPIVTVRGPEIFDKYIGASEAKVREMFERATQMAPSILFLDELEALAPRRGSDSTGVTDRVVNQLLTFLDGVEDASVGTVYIVGATSRPDKVDPAVVRPGRLERHLYLGPPETDEEWTDLLVRVSKQWNLTPECSAALRGRSLLPIIHGMPRLSPADVRGAFDTAHLHAIHRKLGESSASEIETIEIETADLVFGFQKTKPSLNESEACTLDVVYKPFRGTTSSGYSEEKPKRDSEAPLRTTFR